LVDKGGSRDRSLASRQETEAVSQEPVANNLPRTVAEAKKFRSGEKANDPFVAFAGGGPWVITDS
jgi:hypothetical protein